METQKTELSLQLQTTELALATLEEALREPVSVYVRDASIQRFEYTFELAWKLFRKVGKIEGIEIMSPRQAIRAAYDLKIIDDIEIWFQFLENRNLTSHTYRQAQAESVYATAARFPDALKRAVSEIRRKYSM